MRVVYRGNKKSEVSLDPLSVGVVVRVGYGDPYESVNELWDALV